MFGFTKDEVTTLQRAASATWNEICYDIIQANAECEGVDPYSVTIPRNEVVEVTLDADYMERHVKDKSLYRRFRDLTYRQMIQLVGPVFSSTFYGI